MKENKVKSNQEKEIEAENETINTYTEIIEKSNGILKQRLDEQERANASLKNKLYTTEYEVIKLQNDCEMWKNIAESNNRNATQKEIEDDWKLIQDIINSEPQFWAEVTRLGKDFCKIQIKRTPFAFEVNVKGALEIIKSMFIKVVKEPKN